MKLEKDKIMLICVIISVILSSLLIAIGILSEIIGFIIVLGGFCVAFNIKTKREKGVKYGKD